MSAFTHHKAQHAPRRSLLKLAAGEDGALSAHPLFSAHKRRCARTGKRTEHLSNSRKH